MAENLAPFLEEHDSSAGLLIVDWVYSIANSTIDDALQKVGLPPYTFGNIMSKALHDSDNRRGVQVRIGREIKTIYGDANVMDYAGKLNPRGVSTLVMAQKAVKSSLAEIEAAYSGQWKDSDSAKKALKGADGLYTIESIWPDPLCDGDPKIKSKSMQWKQSSVDELF